MPLIGFVNVGKVVQVRFAADPANQGTTTVSTGWVPRSEGDTVPEPAVQSVAPDTSMTPPYTETVPQTARQLRIVIELPDAGKGTLDVRQDNTLITDPPEAVTSDEIYTVTVLL